MDPMQGFDTGNHRLPRALIALAFAVASLGLSGVAKPADAAGKPTFSSARRLVLSRSALPRHYRYVRTSVFDSVGTWDGDIQPVVAIDRRYGWLEAAQEDLSDPSRHYAGVSAQIFLTARGAFADFGQFFTNSHPQTIYEPGAYWLGGLSLKGFGDRATLYRIRDTTSACPSHLTIGLTFVYGNGIFSAGVCTRTAGERGVRDLARRLLAHVRSVARR